ncbi:hypothetical protein N2152v2_008883 [Parachlorella kessleri]
MARLMLLAVLALCLSSASAKVYFEEKFEADDWKERWTVSDWKKSDGTAGDFEWTAGDWYGDAEADKGIKTTPDARFFAISSELKEAFTNKDVPLVLQYSVKFTQKPDCGGAYIKLLPASSGDKIKSFGGDTPYSIMFGPDICGYSTKKVHVILTKGDKNYLVKKEVSQAHDDRTTHVYTLAIFPNTTYQVYVDTDKVREGSIEEDWDIVPPKQITDPDATKPEDWDERAKIPDPEDKKPEGWDDIPEQIPDPEAKQPEDWDEEEDGEWEPPLIRNSEYKGPWSAKLIDNPAYKGKWTAPLIDNPEYKPPSDLHVFPDTKFVGFELWQVKSGSIFDNILVADDLDYALQFAKDTWGKSKEAEKAMLDKVEEEERKKAEEEAAEAEKEAKDDSPGDGDDYGDEGDEPAPAEDATAEEEAEVKDEL